MMKLVKILVVLIFGLASIQEKLVADKDQK